ncbi:MAG TPA: hypothetical protein PLW15_10305 [Rhodoglobus sp.]|nr:hypothetical protein [Rhodoglobus sp.]
MNSSAARFALTIAGALALLMGLIFAGQGANLIPGSFMTGDSTWLVVGIILAVIGVVLLVVALRRRPRS